MRLGALDKPEPMEASVIGQMGDTHSKALIPQAAV